MRAISVRHGGPCLTRMRGCSSSTGYVAGAGVRALGHGIECAAGCVRIGMGLESWLQVGGLGPVPKAR
jgi:hypothetical protein